MKINPEYKKREYTVQFTLLQPKKELEELNKLRNSLPKILKNHKVDIFTEFQPYGKGFIIFLYVLLKETKPLSPIQCAVEEGRLLGYVEKLVGDRYTIEPKSLDGIQKILFYTRFFPQK